MKQLLITILCIVSLIANGQNDTTKYFKSYDYGWSYPRIKVRNAFILPSDTINNKLGTAILNDTLYNGNGTRWKIVSAGGSGGGTFSKNIIMNGTSSNRLGNYINGDTIPVAGLSLDSAFKIIAQRAVPPTYIQPTASISGNIVGGYYEIGTTLNLSFSSTFTQNDAGALTSTTYYKNATTALASNTDTYVLTSPVTYKATKTYSQGACKVDNLGNINCTGRINAGSISSGNINYLPESSRYWGQSSSASPSNSTILASLNGGSELSFIKDKYGFSIGVSGTNQYVYYCYPSAFGPLSSIIISGLESIGAFNSSILNVTNAQGYTQSYYLYVSQNQFNNTNISFNSVN